MVVEQLPAMLWATDLDLVVLSSAGSGLSALKMELSEVIGRTVFDCFGTSDRQFQPISQHLRALRGETTRGEFTWHDNVYECRVDPHRDAHGATRVSAICWLLVNSTGSATSYSRATVASFLRSVFSAWFQSAAQ